MKSSTPHQSATSLPRAPRDEAESRSVRYLALMGVRVACFVLMIVVQPLGWYTWVFGAGAIFIPYIAVVLANVAPASKTVPAVPPERALDAPAADADRHASGVIRVEETHALPRPPHDEQQ